jgi:6-phospho-beta-glucosidase
MKKVSSVLGESPEKLYFDYIGVNHMGWIQDVRKGKASQMDRLFDRIEDHSQDGFDYALIELYRMVPTSTVGLFFHTDKILKEQKKLTKFRAEVLQEAEAQILKLYENKRLNQIPRSAWIRNTPWYEETITPLIRAMERKEPSTLVLCVRNQGAIRDLADTCSVEVPVDVSATTYRPHRVGSCPRFLRSLMHGLKESERCVIEAVRHKSYESALQAFVANPLVPSVDSGKAYLDRIIRDEALQLH